MQRAFSWHSSPHLVGGLPVMCVFLTVDFWMCSERFCVHLRLSQLLPEPFWTYVLLFFVFYFMRLWVCACVCLCVWGSKRERDGGEFLTVCLHCVFDCARECVCVYVTSACWLTGCCSAFWQTVPLNHAAVVTRGDRTPSPPPDSSIRVSHALNEEVNMLNCLL